MTTPSGTLLPGVQELRYDRDNNATLARLASFIIQDDCFFASGRFCRRNRRFGRGKAASRNSHQLVMETRGQRPVRFVISGRDRHTETASLLLVTTTK
jgi:hypothetical protein